MLKNQSNSCKQGDVGTGMAIAYFTTKGWTVSIPLADNQAYDLIIDMKGELNRVQVKTTYCKTRRGYYQANLTTKNPRKGEVFHFDNDLVDYLFILTEEQDMYFIPTNAIDNRKSINLGKKVEQYKVLFE